MSQVSIIDIEGNHPTIPTRFDANVGFAIPIANVLEILGEFVPAGVVPVQTTGSGNTIITQVQTTQAIAASNADNIGLAAFNDAHFSVDSNGFVSLSSAPLGTITGDDGVIVSPDVDGNIDVLGSVVANGTNIKPVFTKSNAGSEESIEVQLSAMHSTTDINRIGLSSYNILNFLLDSNAFVTSRHGFEPGVSNLGITYSAGVFSVTAANGSALSAASPGFITLQSKIAGELRTLVITANQSFTDDTGASTIAGNLFGVASGIAIGNNIPFFLYAVLNDTETAIAFMVSRFPNTKVSPVAAKIGQSGSAIASTQGSFFSLATITAADYESNPALVIGSFRMTMSAANDWTVSALDQMDGIGCYQEERAFTWATGLWGAASGSYFYANGGTAPNFVDPGIGYWLNKNNEIHCSSKFVNCNSAGLGAVNLQLALPFIPFGDPVGSTRLVNGASLIFSGCAALTPGGGANRMINYAVNDAASLVIQNASVTASANYQIGYFFVATIDFNL